jgi:hypothetical protein
MQTMGLGHPQMPHSSAANQNTLKHSYVIVGFYIDINK